MKLNMSKNLNYCKQILSLNLMIASRFVRAVLKALRLRQKRMVLPANHHTMAASSTGTQHSSLRTTVDQARANRARKVEIVARHAFIIPVGFRSRIVRLVHPCTFDNGTTEDRRSDRKRMRC